MVEVVREYAEKLLTERSRLEDLPIDFSYCKRICEQCTVFHTDENGVE